jgi:5-methylcytosine-specific restriction enzyme A
MSSRSQSKDQEIDRLRPVGHARLIDLVREAGVSVDDWSKFEGGADRASTNPKYCYEWSFHDPRGMIVVSIWHDGLKRVDGEIVLEDNLRETAEFYRDVPNKANWRRRAETFDRLIALAATERLPVRVIICDGVMRAKFDLKANASEVRARRLDSAPWAVTAYESRTGRFTLTRAALPGRLVDQFSSGDGLESPTERENKEGLVFVRDPAVRNLALARARGRCESGVATSDLFLTMGQSSSRPTTLFR